MAQLTERLLEKCATEVVDGFFGQDIPMTEGVVKVAERENLNPEQIKRLVEAANNMAFQRKFGEAEGPDKMDASEFQTADPNAALQKLIGAAKEVMDSLGQSGCGESCPSDLSADLPTSRPDMPKLDMAGPEDNINKVGEPKVRGHIMVMRLRKTAEDLQDQKYQRRVALTETLQKLATTFTRLNGAVFEEFEKDAFYKWGGRAAPHLQLLRQCLKKEAASYDHGAMTKTARVIDSSTREMQLLQQMMNHSRDIGQLDLALDKAAEYLKNLQPCPS